MYGINESISTDCVHASSVNVFKGRIDKHLVRAGSSSQRISSSGRRCSHVLAKSMPVPPASPLAVSIVPNISVMSFAHLCLVFPLPLFPATIPCIIVFSRRVALKIVYV